MQAMTSEGTLRRIPGILEQIGAVCAGLLMITLVAITFVDVVGRQFGFPLSFAFEFTQVAVGIMFYVTLPLVTLRGEHIVVDLVPYPPGSRLSCAVEAFVNLLSTFLLAMATMQLWQQGETLKMFHTVMMFTRWPVAPFVFFMSALSAVTAAVLFGLALRSLHGAFRPSGRVR